MSSAPIEVCCLYASDDEPLRRALEKHVSAMKRQGLISLWHDQQIAPGQDRIGAMDAHLNSAAIILLLVSPDFLASDDCYEVALQRAMERHSRNEARVVPVLVRTVDYQGTLFAGLAALPTGDKAITSWVNQDEAWLDVASSLRRVMVTLSTGSPTRQRGGALPPKVVTANREAMLVLLQRFYEDLLTGSLREAVWVELGLAEQPAAVQNAANLVLRQTTQPARPLPPGTSILQVYQQAHRELLILGTPGSGKSTLLYQLGRDLITEAAQQSAAPLPILFPLSSWANARLPLEKWMVEQLTSPLYRVPRQQSQQWVEQEQIVPLLDGLDEMDEATRPACIEAINAYQLEHPLHPLIVCCRSEEYVMAIRRGQGEGRLLLQNAVEVQLLSPQQLDATLVQAGKPFAALRSELKQNAELRELARTPLWLNVLLLTFKDTPVRALSRQSSMLQKQVFASYVQRQIEKKGDCERYPPKQTEHWLSWLAGQMRINNLTEWAIEQLQPSWLTQRTQRIYYGSVRLGAGLSYGLLFGLIYVLIGNLIYGLIPGLIGSLFIGLTIGLLLWWISDQMKTIALVERIQWSWDKARSGFLKGQSGCLLFVLFFWLLLWLFGGLRFGLSSWPFGGLLLWLSSWPFGGLLLWLSSWPFGGLLLWLLVGLIYGLIFGLSQDSERYTLSLGDSLRRLLKNGLLQWPIWGLIAGLVGGLTVGLSHGVLAWLIIGLIIGLLVGLIFGLIGGLFYGLNTNQDIERHTLSPGDGLRRSLTNGLIFGLIGGLSVGLPVGLTFGLRSGLLFGPFVGLSAGLVKGLGAWFQHVLLRFWLWRRNALPFYLVLFLEDARARHLLRRVGGSYQFLHRLLLDYFADLEHEPPAPTDH